MTDPIVNFLSFLFYVPSSFLFSLHLFFYPYLYPSTPCAVLTSAPSFLVFSSPPPNILMFFLLFFISWYPSSDIRLECCLTVIITKS